MLCSARQTGSVGSLNDKSSASSVDALCCVTVFQPASPAWLRQPRDGIAREVRTWHVWGNGVQPGTAARQEGWRSSMFLIYSFTASKEENAVKKVKASHRNRALPGTVR